MTQEQQRANKDRVRGSYSQVRLKKRESQDTGEGNDTD